MTTRWLQLFTAVALVSSFTMKSFASVCDDAVSSNHSVAEYSSAITQLARGIIGLESMKISGLDNQGAQISLAKQLVKQKQELEKTLGADELEAALGTALDRESNILAAERVSRQERRKEALEKEQIFGDWKKSEVLVKYEHLSPEVHISKDSRFMITTADELGAQIWDLKTRKVIRTLKEDEDFYGKVEISPNGELAMAAAMYGSVRVWNIKTGQLLFTLDHKIPQDGVKLVHFSEDGRFILTASSNNQKAQVWSAENGELHLEVERLDSLVNVEFSPNGQFILVASAKTVSTSQAGRVITASQIEIYNLNTKSVVQKLPKFNGLISAGFTPDGQSLITSSWAATGISIWNFDPQDSTQLSRLTDLLFRKKAKPLTHAMGWANAVKPVLSKDVGFVLPKGSGYNPVVYETSDYRSYTRVAEIMTESNAKYFSSIKISPDNKLVVVTESSLPTKIFDLRTGILSQYLGDISAPYDIYFTPDSSTIITSNANGEITIWNREQAGDSE